MFTPFTATEAQKALAEIAAKAQTDADFRALALKDAAAAIKQVTGQDLPSYFKIRFIDGTGYHATFVLPPAKGAEGHLSEDDLDNVSGGTWIPWDTVSEFQPARAGDEPGIGPAAI